MNKEVEDWLALAKQTQLQIEQASQGFQDLSDSYSSIRDVGFKNNEKEAIDIAYMNVNEARAKLAEIQAGGKRSSRSGKRSSRSGKRKTRKNRRVA